METQKVINLSSSSENEYSEFTTKKWHVINSETKGGYPQENLIKFLTSSLESSLCAYILVTGDIAVKNGNDADFTAAAKVVFKNLKIAE